VRKLQNYNNEKLRLTFFADALPAVLLYFFGPISILLIMNLVLFIRTAIRIVKLRKGTGMLKRNADSQSSSEKQQK